MRIKSTEDMKLFAEKIGRLLTGGELIELVGDVGAGKTTFVHGLAKGMGITEQIQSPSFTISRVYDLDDGRRLAHYDFYRLHDPGIMVNELQEALSDAHTVVVIEWADAVQNVLPDERLTLHIKPEAENTRTVKIEANGVWAQKITELLK